MNQSANSFLSSITFLRPLLLELNLCKVFLVTGDSFFQKCGAESYIDSISEEFTFHKFSGFQDNPKIEDVREGIQQFLLFKPDVIVAIGGGSIIDMAKLVNGLYQIDIMSINESVVYNKIIPDVLPFIAIPTTAGSGSESTHFAVVYLDNKKYSLAHKVLIPSHVILDINLLKSQPRYQKAVSGIDALSQAIESFWSINSTDESRGYSIKAIELLWFNLLDVINNQNDDNLSKVFEGAHLAGKAINIAKTTAPHALAYGFTTYFGLAHGHSVALSLPYFVELHSNVNSSNCVDQRGELWVLNSLDKIANIINVPSKEMPDVIASFIQKCGLEINFPRLHISEASFINATCDVNSERLGNNPVKVDSAVIGNLFNYRLNNL